MEIRGYSDIRGFAERVRPWLLRQEAEHNLLLGLLPVLMSAEHGFEHPIYLSSVEINGEVAGCAFRTPPFKLGITRLPKGAIAPLMEHVAATYSALPAVLGPEEESVRFAELWSERNGCAWSLGMRQRIHQCARVDFPGAHPDGELRAASDADMPLLVEWMDAFSLDIGISGIDHRARAESLILGSSLFLWEDSVPRSMVAATAKTPHGVRLGYVYTPEAFRGSGFATIAVASLTDRLLREGRRMAFLYTDLSNTTSNSIYARIGYEPVCDVIDANFSNPRSSSVIAEP